MQKNVTVEIYVLENNAYRLHTLAEEKGKLLSPVLKGFKVDAERVLD